MDFSKILKGFDGSLTIGNRMSFFMNNARRGPKEEARYRREVKIIFFVICDAYKVHFLYILYNIFFLIQP